MQKLTVVQMLPDLDAGGVERGTLELGRYLTDHGHRSLVLSAGGRLVRQLEDEGSCHLHWPVGVKSPFSLRFVPSLRRLLIHEKVDILHLRSRVPAWVGYLAWKSLPKATRPRLVTTFHGIYSKNAYSAVMTKGEKVIAISTMVADHITENYSVDANRIALIYRGVDTTQFDPDAIGQDRFDALRSLWGLKLPGPPLILLPARITRLKGHDVFIRALAEIMDLDWIALCLGNVDENPAYAAEIRALIDQCRLTGRVHLVGHCRDMPAALQLAEVVVSATSSKPEAFGRIAVEAGAMATPVIATAHGGSLETIKHEETGWLVEPGNAAAMAGALRQAILSPEKRQRLGENSRALVLSDFTCEQMCSKTVALYQQMMAS